MAVSSRSVHEPQLDPHDEPARGPLWAPRRVRSIRAPTTSRSSGRTSRWRPTRYEAVPRACSPTRLRRRHRSIATCSPTCWRTTVRSDLQVDSRHRRHPAVGTRVVRAELRRGRVLISAVPLLDELRQDRRSERERLAVLAAVQHGHGADREARLPIGASTRTTLRNALCSTPSPRSRSTVPSRRAEERPVRLPALAGAAATLRSVGLRPWFPRHLSSRPSRGSPRPVTAGSSSTGARCSGFTRRGEPRSATSRAGRTSRRSASTSACSALASRWRCTTGKPIRRTSSCLPASRC